MATDLLNRNSTIQCPHGGQALLTTANSKVSADHAAVLLESDIHTITGCPFTVGNSPSPCVRIDWSGGASMVKVNGTAVLLKTSIGQCLNGAGGLQGMAVVVNTQMKASAR